jgi:glycolate oxidase FAD binding subunit
VTSAAAAANRQVLAGIVGNSHVRDATAEDAVAGVAPSLVVDPGDEGEVAAVLACASRDGLAVVARGSGTKLDWTPPPQRCALLLSTVRLDALVEHEPGDLVCVVQAGMRLRTLQAALAPHGQRLALDPGHGVAATLGGIAAAGAWGPLRTRYGTMRDAVIGARFVLADGTVGHSGGKVVKNVAGYDVAKLLLGSHGTLAMITQLALRLHPVPRASRTLRVTGLDAAGIDSLWRAIDVAPAAVAAMAALWPDRTLLVRVEGSDAGGESQVAALEAATLAAAPAAERRPLEAAEAERAWEDARTAPWGGDPAPVATIGVPRTALAALLDHTSHGDTATRWLVHPRLGLAEARLHPATTPADVAALRSWAEAHGGHLVVRRPTPALAAVAWPAPTPHAQSDAAIDLMRGVKHALDPQGTLAPGRFLGGI